MNKTIFTNPKKKKFSAINFLQFFNHNLLETPKIKSRIPENLKFWFEETNNNYYFLGVTNQVSVLSWPESKALLDYILDIQPTSYELDVSDEIQDVEHLNKFIELCIEKQFNDGNNTQNFYVRNTNSFSIKKIPENVHLITIEDIYE